VKAFFGSATRKQPHAVEVMVMVARGTLQVRMRQPNKGFNAAGRNVYIAELCH